MTDGLATGDFDVNTTSNKSHSAVNCQTERRRLWSM